MKTIITYSSLPLYHVRFLGCLLFEPSISISNLAKKEEREFCQPWAWSPITFSPLTFIVFQLKMFIDSGDFDIF
ncbi:MAG: hypothetical protein QUS12_07460, partial [Methanosarcina sp.]|nr:hypothetical protein [Methanosarcina sp.]